MSCAPFWAYHEALMRRESGLSKAEREMIVVATSANSCLYCVVAHGAILRIYEKSTQISDQIATNFRKADITDRQKAMLIFAEKVALQSERIVRTILRRCTDMAFLMRTSGILAQSQLFLSNRMASLTSMR